LENYRNKFFTFSRWSLFEVCNDNWTKKSLNVSLDSEKDYDDNNIYYYILSTLLGGRSIYSKIKVIDGEQKTISWQYFLNKVTTSSTVPYFVGDCGVPNKCNTIKFVNLLD